MEGIGGTPMSMNPEFSLCEVKLVLGKADPGTFFQCKNIEEGNAIIEDGKRQVFFLNIKKR